jgi:alpha-D-ribose 1-methylphosphonate 5-triphosphate diphosphatase PhnM
MSYPGFSTTYKLQTLASATVVVIATRPVSRPASSFLELSVLMASPNNLHLKNYSGSIAPSQLADAGEPARDGCNAWSWQEIGGP